MRKLLNVAITLLFAGAGLAQDATVPPPSQHAVLTLQGSGVQIDTCAAGHWIFVAPAARLFDKDGLEVGTHGDGTVWHLQDGSSVDGKVIAKSPSPDANSLPWLLIKATGSTGDGVLARVESIRRSDTKGGVAPSGGCDAKHAGELARIPYSTTYTFYSSK